MFNTYMQLPRKGQSVSVFIAGCGLIVLMYLQSEHLASAGVRGGRRNEGTEAGIVIEKGDLSIKVRADRDQEVVEYDARNSEIRTREVLKTIYTTNRVHLAYKRIGDSCQLVSISKQRPVAKGTVMGEVMHNHGSWIEVKPDNGPCEAYAVRFPLDRNKEVKEQLSRLNELDIVVIRFTTDATGHRIQSIWKTGTASGERQLARQQM
jgi:hypothetical protein